MHRSIRCISIDIDGTLIPEYSFRADEMSMHNIWAIKVFCNSGGKVILATGRALPQTKLVYDHLIKHGIPRESIPYLVCLNGAIVVDTLNNYSTVFEKFFRSEICVQSQKLLQDKKVNFFLVNSNNEVFFKKNFFSEFVYFFIFRNRLSKKYLEQLQNYENIQKIMVFLKWPRASKLKKEFSIVTGEDCYCSLAHEFFLEIIDSKINKFFALQHISKLLNIPISEFAAIGNEQNDIMSLENVGIGCGVDLKRKGKEIVCDLEKIKFCFSNKKKRAVSEAIKFIKDSGYF